MDICVDSTYILLFTSLFTEVGLGCTILPHFLLKTFAFVNRDLNGVAETTN